MNLADGNYDEEAERVAFQRAVMEWRTGKSSSTAAAGANKTATGTSSSGDASLWNNPFAATDTTNGDDEDEGKSGKAHHSSSAVLGEDDGEGEEGLDEAAERAAFQRAVAEWRNSSKDKDNDNADTGTGAGAKSVQKEAPRAHITASARAAQVVSEAKKLRSKSHIVSLAEGTLDEGKEHEVAYTSHPYYTFCCCKVVIDFSSNNYLSSHVMAMLQEFRRAVDAWRSGKSASGNSDTQLQADKLSQQMERQHEVTAARMLEQQELARQRLVEVSESERNNIPVLFSNSPIKYRLGSYSDLI